MISSVNVSTSRYSSGGTTEVGALGLEWWDRTVMETDDSDILLVIDVTRVNRLDLIAKEYLGNTALWWLLAQYNAILDPSTEIVIGRVIRIPQKSRLQQLMSGKTGGVASQREFEPQIGPLV